MGWDFADRRRWRRVHGFMSTLHLRVGFIAIALCLLQLAGGADAQPQEIKTSFGSGLLIEKYNKDAVVCSSWILLPGENMWNRWLRAFLYFAGLVYMFLGVAIISDIFMASIERITAHQEVVTLDPHSGQEVKVKIAVWNETVANLTLLALGSSAPEILLSVVETVSNLGKPAGELGPSTIVGSAAFNLFMIIALCISAVDEPKRIKEIGVFIITSVSSLFAYFWMVVVLVFVSPDVVSIWEAWVTLAFFPILVVMAWVEDRKFYKGGYAGGGNRVLDARVETDGSSDRNKVAQLWKRVAASHEGEGADEETELKEVAQLAASTTGHMKVSRAVYRMNAIRMLSANKKVLPHHHTKANHLMPVAPDGVNFHAIHPSDGGRRGSTNMYERGGTGYNPNGVISFSSKMYSVLESEGSITINVERLGGVEGRVSVDYYTKAGSAKPGEDYKEAAGTVTFEPNESVKTVAIVIVDDTQYEPDESFSVHLINATGGSVLGRHVSTEVVIIDDDKPGELSFDKRSLSVEETAGEAVLTVLRRNGSDGFVSVCFKTEPDSAVDGREYRGVHDGVLDFQHGESSKTIHIPIIDESTYEKDAKFSVELFNTSGGAERGFNAKCIVTITADEKVKAMVDRVIQKIEKKKENYEESIMTHSWTQQFRNAMNPVGDEDDDDEEGDEDGGGGEPDSMTYVMHFLTFFWKVVFALCPPTDMYAGKLTFVSSLLFIGIITAIVAELAALFGCTVGLEDSLTAITFVALGTSLPDTFASKQAAIEEMYSDAAVGNVTGSNSVNVFLGLGLPWVIASAWYHGKGKDFEVPAGDLAFSVMVFLVCATIAIVTLFIRRYTVGGELGGPNKQIVSIIFSMLWFAYVLLTFLRVKTDVFPWGKDDA